MDSELELDRFHVNHKLLHPALKFTVEKEQNNPLNFLDASVEKGGLAFSPAFTSQYIRWNYFSPKAREINLIKTLVQRALTICSKAKLDSNLDTIRQMPIDNGYPDVLTSCIKEKLANISSGKQFGPESVRLPKVALDWKCFIKICVGRTQENELSYLKYVHNVITIYTKLASYCYE